MNRTVIPIAPDVAASRQCNRQAPRGRRVEPAARAEVEALIGPGPIRRDLLIEYLHRIQVATHWQRVMTQDATLPAARFCRIATSRRPHAVLSERLCARRP